MGSAQHARSWEELARLDPLWAIASTPAFRYGGWDEQAFTARGQKKAKRIVRWLRSVEPPATFRRALDFGCGVGRISIPLARYFETVVGVDVSPTMLKHARTRAAAAGRGNVGFLLNQRDDLDFLEDEQFDFVYTSLVLQHLPTRGHIERYARALARLVAPGGALVAQVPGHIGLAARLQIPRRAYVAAHRVGVPSHLLYRRLRVHPIRMRAYPRARFEALLLEEGLRILRIDERASGGGVSCTYRAVRASQRDTRAAAA